MNMLYIFTGGPGSGKTTLLQQLEKRGYCVIAEVGRAVIQNSLQCNSNALPWADKQLFYEQMLAESIFDYQKMDGYEGTVFFDRGVLDSIGYARLEGLSVSEEDLNRVNKCRYMTTVFILPPWQEIYENDSERKQDFKEAVRTYEVMKRTYIEFGYTIVEIPKVSVSERVKFVEKYLLLVK